MNITKITAENFQDIYSEFKSKVKHWLFTHGVPASDLDDCAQNAWMTCWAYRDQFDPKYPISVFVFLQARAAASWHRRQQASQIKHLGYSSPIAEDHFYEEDMPGNTRAVKAHIPTEGERGWPWPMRYTLQIKHAKQTRCKKGHDLTIPENVRFDRDGYRNCVPCSETRNLMRLAKSREATKTRQAARAAKKALFKSRHGKHSLNKN
jgi:hypothetical protein